MHIIDWWYTLSTPTCPTGVTHATHSNCTTNPSHLSTCTAHSPHWHNTTWLPSLATHSPCSCHPITPLTLSTLPILLTPPALLTVIVPTAQSSQSMPHLFPVISDLQSLQLSSHFTPQYKSLSILLTMLALHWSPCFCNRFHSHCLHHLPHSHHPLLPSTVKADLNCSRLHVWQWKRKLSVSRWVAISEG